MEALRQLGSAHMERPPQRRIDSGRPETIVPKFQIYNLPNQGSYLTHFTAPCTAIGGTGPFLPFSATSVDITIGSKPPQYPADPVNWTLPNRGNGIGIKAL